MEQLLTQRPKFQFQMPKFITQDQNRSTFINWTAGLLGGLSSITIFSPFDLARTRHIILATSKSYGVVQYNGFLHTLSKIYHDEGFRGLYKGYNAAAVTVPIFHSLYFAMFYKAKSFLTERGVSDNQPLLRDMASALFTGLVCNTVTNPLWVVRTRIQAQFLHREETAAKYTGLISGLKKMCREEGYKAMFKGLLASYLGLAHCIILFPLYERLKAKISSYKKEELSTTDILLASNISKFVAMTLTYPHVVVRARLQDHRSPMKSLNGDSLEKCRATITSVVKSTIQKEGIKGLYTGLRIDLIRVLPANSITFIVFEYAKKKLEEALPSEEAIYN